MIEEKPVLAVIGGSGLYDMPDLENVEEIKRETPFGEPSGPIRVGVLDGKRVAFLARHGKGHRLNPSEVPYRANIYALKSLGVDRIISVSACGSLREDFAPGEIVIPTQLFDFTKNRQRTFFEEGLVAHISVADPFCPGMVDLLSDASSTAGATTHRGGSFITIEGPRFSTRSESNVYRSWGMSIIGMTTSPEAFLAREAEICYAVMAHVTDYDVWHVSEEPVTVEQVLKIIQQNTETARQAVRNVLQNLPEERTCDCSHALQNAMLTTPAVIPPNTRQRLEPLVQKYLG